jgi:hypothetical protein
MSLLDEARKRVRRELAERNGHARTAAVPTVPAGNSYHPFTKPEGRTDVNNAARLGARYSEVVRWVGPWDKWLIWDGKRWKVDQALAIELKAKRIAADLWVEIAAALRENKE